jgi:hypothetical protein
MRDIMRNLCYETCKIFYCTFHFIHNFDWNHPVYIWEYIF